MDSKDIDITLPLSGLLKELQRQGFDISGHTYIQVQNVLLYFRDDYRQDPLVFKKVLCPVLAKNAEQQEKFYRTFDEYVSGDLEQEAIALQESILLSKETKQGEEQKIRKRSRNLRMIFWGLVALVAATLATVFILSKVFGPSLESFPVATDTSVSITEIEQELPEPLPNTDEGFFPSADDSIALDLPISEGDSIQKLINEQDEEVRSSAFSTPSYEEADCTERKPAAFFLLSANPITLGEQLTIANQGQRGDSLLISWSFGDGRGRSFNQDSLLAYTYRKAGEYLISLTVRSFSTNCDSTYTELLIVNDIPIAQEDPEVEATRAGNAKWLAWILRGLLIGSIMLSLIIYILWFRTQRELRVFAVSKLKPPYTFVFDSFDHHLKPSPEMYRIAN